MQHNKNEIKILHLGNQAFGFATFMLKHFNYFKERGYHIEVAFDTSIDKIFIDKLKEHGYKIHHINFQQRDYSIKNFVRVFTDCMKLFKQEKFDVIIAHFPVVSLFIRVAAKLSGVKKVVHFQHALSFNAFSNKSIKITMPHIERLVNWFFTDYLICINPEDKQILIDNKLIQKEKIYYLNSLGVDTEHYKKSANGKNDCLLKDLKISKNDIVISIVCRMIAPKGIYELMEAAKSVVEEKNNVYFLYIGDGKELDNLKKLSLLNNLNNNIIFTGYTDNVKDYLDITDIFVLPSYYQEGMPISILEAMSMERPVIVSDNKGCRNIVTDNYDGLIVKPKDKKTLAEKIIYLCNNPDEMIRLGNNGRKTVLEKYCKDIILEEHQKILESIINKCN